MCREGIRLCQQHNTVHTYTIFKPCDLTVYAQLQTRHFALRLLVVIYEILVVRKKVNSILRCSLDKVSE